MQQNPQIIGIAVAHHQSGMVEVKDDQGQIHEIPSGVEYGLQQPPLYTIEVPFITGTGPLPWEMPG